MSLFTWNTTMKTEKIHGGLVRRIANEMLASPRALLMDAPIEGHDPTVMIGAAEDFPRRNGIRTIPVPMRMTIDVTGIRDPNRDISRLGALPNATYRVWGPTISARPPESSTPKDAAMEGAAQRAAARWVSQWVCAPFARDTDVVLAKIHAVDDARDSGARMLRPGVFSPCAGLEAPRPAP